MDTKNENKDISEIEIITAYAQLVIHTLQHSGMPINAKTVQSEIKMFYEKFGNDEVKRLAKIMFKEKKRN